MRTRHRLGRAAALAAALAALAAFPAGAFDFGLTLSNDSTYTYQGAGSLQQLDRALAWVSSPVGAGADFYASGLYEFKGSFAKGSSDVTPWPLDIGRTEITGSAPGLFGPSSTLRYAAGRTELGDFSGLVLAGLSDGTRLEADFGNVSAYFLGGYRGLLYRGDAYSLMNANDLAIAADTERFFAPPRAFAGAGARIAELVKAQDFGIEALAQFDLSSESGRIQTQYLEPYGRGRLGRLVSWQAWGIAELGEADTTFFAAALGESLSLSLPELAGLRLGQGLQWASGEQGSMKAFVPIRRAPIDGTSLYTFTDLLKAKLDASVSPAERVALGLGLAAYFRSAATDPEGGMALRADPAYFRGLEVSANASAKLASDLSLNASGAVLVPNTATAYEGSAEPRYLAELYAAFDL